MTDRYELSDLIGEMVGELSALHTYIWGGDLRKGPEDAKTASLGARLVRDDNQGGYRVDYVYQSDPDEPDKLSEWTGEYWAPRIVVPEAFRTNLNSLAFDSLNRAWLYAGEKESRAAVHKGNGRWAEYDNLYADLSAGSGYNAMTRDPEFTLGFIDRHWQKLLWGTDYLAPEQPLPQIAWLKELNVSQEIRQAMAAGNARKVLHL